MSLSVVYALIMQIDQLTIQNVIKHWEVNKKYESPPTNLQALQN